MKKARKALVFLLVLMMTVTMLPHMTVYASAASEYVRVTKHDSYNKDGYFYMKFTIENLQKPVNVDGLMIGEQLVIDAILVDASGTQVDSWERLYVLAGEQNTWGLGTDYSGMPSGTYTLKLNISTILSGDAWQWAYNINHKAPSVPPASIAFKSYETYYDKEGRYIHKFNIHCSNMKGKSVGIKIYNEYGDLVSSNEVGSRKTNNETIWFGWSGYTDGVRYPPGNYTVVVTGGGKTIQTTYYLQILERTVG